MIPKIRAVTHEGELDNLLKKFCELYCGVCNFNGTDAAIRVGITDKFNECNGKKDRAHKFASRSLKKPEVREYIGKIMQRRYEENEEIAQKLIRQYSAIAFCDYDSIASWDGKRAVFKSNEDIPLHLLPCIEQVKNTSSGVEIRLHSKEKAMEMLAKITGLLVETKKVVGEQYESLIDRLLKNNGLSHEPSVLPEDD